MSERSPFKPEQYESLLDSPEHKLLPTAEQAEPLRPGEVDPVTHQLEAARAEIAESVSEDDPLAKLEAADRVASSEARPAQVNTELKSITLHRELKHIQRTLPAAQRSLSKVIHQPVVRFVSEAASKSVSRPSGLLGGGLMAFVGSVSYLYLAKHIGFTYNYFVFALLFIAGFVLGLVLELLVWSVTSRRLHRD